MNDKYWYEIPEPNSKRRIDYIGDNCTTAHIYTLFASHDFSIIETDIWLKKSYRLTNFERQPNGRHWLECLATWHIYVKFGSLMRRSVAFIPDKLRFIVKFLTILNDVVSSGKTHFELVISIKYSGTMWKFVFSYMLVTVLWSRRIPSRGLFHYVAKRWWLLSKWLTLLNRKCMCKFVGLLLT